jgi:hypothetical protein
MSLRETLNTRPRLASGIAAGCAAVAVLLAVAHVMDLRAAPIGAAKPEHAFFTVDDGKTWFVDDAAKLAPFDHNGQQAVRAYVCECDGKQYVNHLERYTDAGKQAMTRVREAAKKGPPPGMLVFAAQQKGREVKRPGDAKWVPASKTAVAGPIALPKKPDGAANEPHFVFPP